MVTGRFGRGPGREWCEVADIRPFRGIRYNQEAVGDLSLVVAPPYDVIDGEARDSYYNRHPYNVVRLTLNRPKRSDAGPDEPYARASQFLDRWLAQRILIQDPSPGIYLYRQRYLIEGNYRELTGLVARVRVQDFSDGVILPHEEIMPKPLEDRMKLLDYTKTNLSMVQALYSDPTEKLKKPILAELERFPLAQFQTADGVAHDVWGVIDDDFAKRMIRFFKGKKLYIADGHHRYQTALEYSQRAARSGTDAGEEDPRHYLMMLIVEMENPGLSLLPVHRVVKGVEKPDVEGIARSLEPWFTVREVEVPSGSRSGQVYHLLRKLEGSGEDGRVFGVFLKEDRFLLLAWKPDLDAGRVIGGDQSAAYKNLDVTVLHRIVIERVLGIPHDRASVERNILFMKDPLEAVRSVDSGEGAMAFFMNPTKVGQVRDTADHGEKMPQKSTYFHPKPCSGVIMNRITEW